MKIYKKGDKIICELDYWQHKNNCYDPEEEKELTSNLIGVITEDDCSISHLIDLSYKDDQQIGMPIIQTSLEEEDFKKLCKEIGIDCHKYPSCSRCGKVIYGSYTMSKDYDKLCYDCVHELGID